MAAGLINYEHISVNKKTDNVIEVSSAKTKLPIGRVWLGPQSKFVFIQDKSVEYIQLDILREITSYMDMLDQYGKEKR